LVVDNESNASVLVAKEKVFVVDAIDFASLGRKVAVTTIGTENAMNAAAAVFGAGLILAPAASLVAGPLLLAGAKSMSNAEVIRHNLSDKALYSHTVGPGQRAHGFVYFELPESVKLETRQVIVELHETASDQPLTFVFRLGKP
jgi:hypothetical protein